MSSTTQQAASYEIGPAHFPDDKPAIVALFNAYATALGIDLTFQGFQDEVDSLPGKYSPERGGQLLVARATAPTPSPSGASTSNTAAAREIVGCVALRALDSDDPDPDPDPDTDRSKTGRGFCEMKRLYVTPVARGSGLGAKLVDAIIQHARSLDRYRGIRLDTLPGEMMVAARALYYKRGFRRIAPYYETPIEGTIFLELEFWWRICLDERRAALADIESIGII